MSEREDFVPYCCLDDASGDLTGALADYLSFAETCEKNARLSFETRAFETTEAAMEALSRGEIDCVFPVNLSAYDAEIIGAVITDPARSSPTRSSPPRCSPSCGRRITGACRRIRR